MKGFFLMPHPPIMIPEVGHGREKEIQKTMDACEKIADTIAGLHAETIVLVTPHGNVFRDAVSVLDKSVVRGDFAQFGAPQSTLEMNVNEPLVKEIMRCAEEDGVAAVALNDVNAMQYRISLELDHGALVPLYYIHQKGTYRLVHITYGMLTPLELYRFGMSIARAVKNVDASAVFVASGDLSHRLSDDGPYSYSPYGAQFDEQLLEHLKAGDFEAVLSMNSKLIEEAGECGLRSVYMLAGAMDGYEVTGRILSYEGTFGVGYGVVSFQVHKDGSLYEKLQHQARREHEERMKTDHPYPKLARQTLDYYFKTGQLLTAPNEAVYTSERKGVFVSIKLSGALRGCIGTIEPTTANVGAEIVRNAIAAATEDPRFSRMTLQEVYEADISVDVLHPPEPATREQLDPKQYGVIVSKGARRGLLLPNLEGVETVDEQLHIALDKADIDLFDTYEIERFKVERFSEVEGDD